MTVHNHGTEDGPGLSCPEVRINGELKGKCMNAQVIPEVAIEAACRAEFSDWDTNGDEWWRGMTRNRMRAALEAAAPHMLAEDRGDLWDEGNLAGKEASHRFERTNPYTRHAREN